MHHVSLYFETTAQIPEVEFGGKYGYMRANMDIIYPVFALRQTLTFSYYWTCKNEHIATKICDKIRYRGKLCINNMGFHL